MRNILVISFFLIWFHSPLGSASDAHEDEKAGSSQGIQLDDIGRGLKSAAKNIGDEIPKIGPAIGDTFKKLTGKDNAKEKASKKSSAQSPKDKNQK